MNTQNLRMILLALLAFGAAGAQAYTAPSEDRLDQVLANPNLIRIVLDDAKGQEACELLQRILAKVDAAPIPAIQKEYLAAYYSARITFLLADESIPFARCLLPTLPASLRTAVVSGIAVGGQGSAALLSFLRSQLGNDPILLQAINSPQAALGDTVFNQLIDSLRGVQSLPPILTDSLAPPGDGTSPRGPGVPPPPAPRRGGGPPPPVPQPYAGQQNP